MRFNLFDLSIAPAGDNRTEMGAYVQDEMFLSNAVRVSLGARFDKFDNIEDPVFSPRVALILKPANDHAVRLSFNKAFRSPSLINNYLDTAIVNQVNLGAINPALAGVVYNFPVRATGNQDLVEESTESFEIAYTGSIKNRATVSAAMYWTTNRDEIFFTQVGRYRAFGPPPGWPLPPVVLDLLPPPCVDRRLCTTGGLPSEFSYENLGTVKNKGLELGIDGAVNRALNLFANYSYQAEPDPDFAMSEMNLPPQNRFNAGLNFSEGRYLATSRSATWTRRTGRTCSTRAMPGRPRRIRS